MERHTFNKSEKLKSKKAIELLFRSGQSITTPPIRLIYKSVTEGKFPVRMTVVVPKKLVNRAVDRNLIKRRIREVYRLNKTELCKKIAQKNLHYNIVFFYQSEDISSYKIIQSALISTLYRLEKKL